MAEYQRRAPLGIIPHDSFMKMSSDAELSHYRHHPYLRVANRAEFVRMQEHLEKLYDGVEAQHSFVDPSGQIFDCIPIMQQPGLRNHRGPLPTPPDLTKDWGLRPAAVDPPKMHTKATRDPHGNLREGPAGTVPIRRITLDEMIRYPDLETYFSKYGASPAAAAALEERQCNPTAPSSDGRQNHRYAVGSQSVGNIGGTSYLAVYQPGVDANQVFSLSQQWYVAGTWPNVQTVEVGWQVLPTYYNTQAPCLFVFYTPDGYTSGSYNTVNTNTFVQTHTTYTLGGALPNISTVGGAQEAVRITTYLSGGYWWIYVGGVTNDDILGYYPATLFGTGPMATAADTIQFGGETVSGVPPNGNWGPMGSGNLGSTGWQQAAYHCYCAYWGTDNSANWTNLSQIGPSSCYSFNGGFDNAYWGTYFFFGGPGGSDC